MTYNHTTPSNETTIDSNVVEDVKFLWEQIRSKKVEKDYKGTVGTFLVRELVELSPRTLAFPFQECSIEEGSGITMYPEEHLRCQRIRLVLAFSAVVVRLEMAIQLVLGPDPLDSVNDQLLELGRKKSRFGVSHKQFAIVGDALMEALELVLGRKALEENCNKESWKTFYEYVSSTVMKGEERSRLLKEMAIKSEGKRILKEQSSSSALQNSQSTIMTEASFFSENTDVVEMPAEVVPPVDYNQQKRPPAKFSKIRRVFQGVRARMLRNERHVRDSKL